tara:strand:+ start:245 stop:769 length:525 start_codon:yes stop_codon:yes gene_type:complete
MTVKKGFTLIELVIVIVIISILSAIALPRFLNLDIKAKEAVLRSALSSMKSAARIGNAFARSDSVTAAGNILINNHEILMVNDYPAGRANDVSASGPGTFGGLLTLMEVDTEIGITYSDTAQLRSALQAQTAVMIFYIDSQCIAYQPPQISGGDPLFSIGVGTYSPGAVPACNL